MAAPGGHEPSPAHHVQDSNRWTFFESLFGDEVTWDLPGFDLPGGYHLQITKFMILELLAAALILAIFIPLARRAQGGALPRGPWWNAFESLLTFVRNEIARPTIGEQEADKFVPFL